MVMDRGGPVTRLGAWAGIALAMVTTAVTVAIWVNNAFIEVNDKLDRNQALILKVCNNQLQADQNLRLHILITATRGKDPKSVDRVLLPLEC